jgi:hypothetical protein
MIWPWPLSKNPSGKNWKEKHSEKINPVSISFDFVHWVRHILHEGKRGKQNLKRDNTSSTERKFSGTVRVTWPTESQTEKAGGGKRVRPKEDKAKWLYILGAG